MRNCRIIRMSLTAVFFGISLLLFSCAAQPPRFKSSQDEIQQRETRSYPMDLNTVWNAVLEAIPEYKIFKKDPVQGLVLTQWRDKIIKNTATIGGTWMHGVKVEDRADTQDKRDMREFVIRNRLHIVVVGNADSSTVSVTNFYTARPKDFAAKAGDEVYYGRKAFNAEDFDTREQYVILNKIGDALKKVQK